MRSRRYGPRPRKAKKPHRINEQIRAPKVRLIDEEKNQVGVMSPQEALEYARKKDLDLVEVSPDAKPPVCRILDYGKYLYALQKKAQEAKKHQRRIHIKEIKFTPAIGDHDVEVKLKKIRQFLEDGNKVKVTIWLRGRQKRKPEMLQIMTDRILKIVGEFSEIESRPKQMNRFTNSFLIGQKKGGGKDAKTKDT